MTPRVLLIDDDRSVRTLVERGLTEAGFQVHSAPTAEDGLSVIESFKPQVALIDIYLPEMNGLELFQKLRALDRKLPIIFITADATSETTIEAMRLGAFDYVAKPLNLDQLRVLTASASEARNLMDQPVAMPLADHAERGERFIGRSPAMVEVFKAIGRVAEQSVTVLIRGESGCGKELVARAIVQHSQRREMPFVAVNCAAIPDHLLESELFGYEKGAFTGAEKRREGKFEHCDGGTIFLDEVGDMSLVVQGKVLRIIQDQKFQRLGGNTDIATDVRIVAATHRNLEEMVRNGEFREDLFYRLNGYTINLPPLRDRPEDISLLLEYFLNRARREMNKPAVEGITPGALDALQNYAWPGNIRQLQSVVRQAMLCTTGTVVGIDSLPKFVLNHDVDTAMALPMDESASSLSSSNGDHSSITSLKDLGTFIERRLAEKSENLYAEVVSELERYLFMRVLEATAGNQSRAATILGITRGKVRDRIATFGLDVDR
jgi:DNA-binding NtrC family response regulator